MGISPHIQTCRQAGGSVEEAVKRALRRRKRGGSSLKSTNRLQIRSVDVGRGHVAVEAFPWLAGWALGWLLN